MKKQNTFIDKVTGLKCEVKDVSTNAGPLEVYVKLENGKIVTRKIKELIYQEEGGEK